MGNQEIFQDLQYLWKIGAPNGILGKLLGDPTTVRLQEQIQYWLKVGPDIGKDNSPEDAKRALSVLMLVNDRVREIAEKYGVKI